MSRNFYIGLLIVAVVGLATLSLSRTPAPVAEQATTAEFGGVSLSLDYATTTATRELGLGGRESVGEDYGMLFVFPKDDRYGFWMKDMLVPLDIFWLDSKGQVVYIAEDVAPSTYPDVFYPTSPTRYVLETTAGFARESGITVGTPLRLKSFPTVTE